MAPHRLPKYLFLILIIYFAASLAHFVHNAEFLDEYPNMPSWISRVQIYAAWSGITAVGLVGLITIGTRMRLFGVLLIVAYAALGFDGLAHYSLAPVSAHSFTMNVTIWLEVVAAGALLVATLWFATRMFGPDPSARRTDA